MEYTPYGVVSEDVGPMVQCYLDAAEWAGLSEEDGETLRALESAPWDPASVARSVADCEAFEAAAAEVLAQIETDPEQTGRDFFLTRNHHGAGFWDRGYPKEVGDALTAAAHAAGECWVYLEGGTLYLYPI